MPPLDDSKSVVDWTFASPSFAPRRLLICDLPHCVSLLIGRCKIPTHITVSHSCVVVFVLSEDWFQGVVTWMTPIHVLTVGVPWA